MTEAALEFVIADEERGLRLDQVVRRRLPGIPRRVLAELFALGHVKVEGRIKKKGDVAEPGRLLTVRRPPADAAPPNPDLPIHVVGENDDWVVVDKPAGMPSVARDGRDESSVASALVARYPAMTGFGHHPREAGLVHRLDVFTSGLLLAAKREAAFVELVSASRLGRLSKEYLAVAPDVRFDHGTILSRLVPKRGVRVVTEELSHVAGSAPQRGELRRTEYAVLERHGRLSLLRISVSAAYRHQIRAQLSAVGSPIVGDRLYSSEFERSRHALHASRLLYEGGPELASFESNSPLPHDLRALLG